VVNRYATVENRQVVQIPADYCKTSLLQTRLRIDTLSWHTRNWIFTLKQCIQCGDLRTDR